MKGLLVNIERSSAIQVVSKEEVLQQLYEKERNGKEEIGSKYEKNQEKARNNEAKLKGREQP